MAAELSTREAAAPLILVMIGVTSVMSHTRALGTAVAEALVARGAQVAEWDALACPLPPADPAFHDDPGGNPDPAIRGLVEAAAASDGVVLVTPVYHNSYSAVLKNALDSLAIQQFHYKPVSLASHGGHRAAHAVDQLRIVTRGLLAVTLPTQICTADMDYGEVADGFELRAPAVLARADRLAAEMLLFARTLRALRATIGAQAAVRARRERTQANDGAPGAA